MKNAMSLDGKIATVTGESQWISGESSRKQVHSLRHELAGIMVGIETIIKDDPQLTSRTLNSRNPIRIVVDSQLRIPLVSKVLTQQDEAKTIVATTKRANKEKLETLKQMGIEVIMTKEKYERVDLQEHRFGFHFQHFTMDVCFIFFVQSLSLNSKCTIINLCDCCV